MDNNDVKVLVEAFKGYRDLLEPVEKNLNDFVSTYDMLKENIDRLNASFGGDVKDNLEKIYRNLSSQAESATNLSSRIEQFARTADKYNGEISRLLTSFAKVEEKVAAVNELESKAEEQIGRLDALLEDKRRNYNVKDLQHTLEVYNANVQKISEFINKDVSSSMDDNSKKLDEIKAGNDFVNKRLAEENENVEKLVDAYAQTNAVLKKIVESGDVNEEYVFTLIDKWAEDRSVKTKKRK